MALYINLMLKLQQKYSLLLRTIKYVLADFQWLPDEQPLFNKKIDIDNFSLLV
jgi:hypothetical protein